MSATTTAFGIEWIKLRHSPVGVVTTLLLCLGTVALTGASLASTGTGGVLAAKSEVLVGDGGWAGLFGVAGQVVAAGGLLGFGVMAGWLYGREFTDGTAAALFARPVPLRAVAQAKLGLYLVWVIAVAVAVPLGLLVLGAVLVVAGTEGFAPGVPVRLMLTVFGITVLTGLLALPCAWVATRTRGYLAAVGAAITIVVLAQISVVLGAGGWFPFAAPGWWVTRLAVADTTAALGATTVLQLALVLPVAAAASVLTVRAWSRLTL